MSVDADRLVEVIRLIVDSDARCRELGAEKATDRVSEYSGDDVAVVASILSLCASCERDTSALEAQLNALLGLGASGWLQTENMRRLHNIDRETLPEPLGEYIDDLLETD
ncbi:hypothetical protein ACFU99_11470 [Streptomyces sp. NPDC057654]|uniref:hypothetical protein n=1 Tax=Streptomyces sp. NPDC057654 TaxID=3346196 RepID=UPI003691AFF8